MIFYYNIPSPKEVQNNLSLITLFRLNISFDLTLPLSDESVAWEPRRLQSVPTAIVFQPTAFSNIDLQIRKNIVNKI